MKTLKIVSVLLLIMAGISSCQTSKSLQNQLRALRTDLDYDLTSPVYIGERDKTVYLNFIDRSNMEYFTTVKKSSALVLPFILYNYWHKKFDIVLGENTFTQPYWEFLTDALAAEGKRSSCFNLKLNDKESITDAYSLDVKIIHNETQSGVQESNFILFLPTPHVVIDFFHNNYQVLSTSSRLEMAVSFKKGKQSLLEKTYTAHEQLKGRSIYDPVAANEECVFTMTECLSVATKQIVTEICRDLNLFLSPK
jgi:hypothetical protein